MAGNAGPGGDAGADAKVNEQSQQNFSTTSNPMLYHRIQHPQRPQVSIEFVQAILELDQVQSLFPQNLQYSLAYHHTRQLLRDAGRGGDGGNVRECVGESGNVWGRAGSKRRTYKRVYLSEHDSRSGPRHQDYVSAVGVGGAWRAC